MRTGFLCNIKSALYSALIEHDGNAKPISMIRFRCTTRPCRPLSPVPSPTLSPTDPVPRGLLTLCPWGSSDESVCTAHAESWMRQLQTSTPTAPHIPRHTSVRTALCAQLQTTTPTTHALAPCSCAPI